MESYLSLHLPRVIVFLENEMNTVTEYFNQFGPEGGKMSYEQLSLHIKAVTGNAARMSAIRRNDVVQYLRSRLGCKFEFDGSIHQWLLVPMPLNWPMLALPPRVIKMIDTIAKSEECPKILEDENCILPTANRMPINVIIKAAKFTRYPDGNTRAAYDPICCNIEDVIHKLRVGILPLKMFLNKLSRNEIQILDNPLDDACYDPIQIFKMRINETAEVRLEKIQTRTNPTSSEVELFVTIRVKRDKATNTEFTGPKYTHTDQDWFINTRPARCATPESDGCQRKLDELREQVSFILACEPATLTTAELYRRFRLRFGLDPGLKDAEFSSPPKIIKKLEPFEDKTCLMGSENMFGDPHAAVNLGADAANQVVSRRTFLDIGRTLQSNPVAVGETFSPIDFYLIKEGVDNLFPLQNISQEITMYYNGQGARVRLASLRPDIFCCTMTGLDTCRAVVLATMNLEKIKIIHVDYSTAALVSIHAMRHQDSDQLPMQAMKGRIDNVCPPKGNGWISPSTEEFVNLVRSKLVSANVAGWDNHGVVPIAELILIDTTSNHDISINPRLVDLGLARLAKPCQRCIKQRKP